LEKQLNKRLFRFLFWMDSVRFSCFLIPRAPPFMLLWAAITPCFFLPEWYGKVKMHPLEGIGHERYDRGRGRRQGIQDGLFCTLKNTGRAGFASCGFTDMPAWNSCAKKYRSTARLCPFHKAEAGVYFSQKRRTAYPIRESVASLTLVCIPPRLPLA